MKKSVVLCLVCALLIAGCTKELGKPVSHEEVPQVAIVVSPDTDSNDSTSVDDNPHDTTSNEGPAGGTEEISDAGENEHDVYSFMGVSGVYFGCSSTFKTGKETLQFIFGTNLTTNLTFTQSEFEELIKPGKREFGTLGAFTSYPARLSGKVEIAYTDNKGRRWSSSRITERKNGNKTEATAKADQKHASFVIENAHKFELTADTEGYRLTGRFECTLYEVNGNAKKKIKGNFTGVVAPK